MKTTPWFPWETPPSRPGLYEVRGGPWGRWSYYRGGKFNGVWSTKSMAAGNRRFGDGCTGTEWRGLTTKDGK